MSIFNHLNFTNRKYLRWFFLALIVRACVFVFFCFEFNQNWPSDLLHSSVVVFHHDTSGYYDPLENMHNGLGYDSSCRLPGLAPVYSVARLFFTQENAILFIVLLQIIVGAISVVALASSAFKLLKSEVAFQIVFFSYALSSFVSIWDHAALSDSFSISFLVFAFYFLVRLKDDLRLLNAFLFGLFFTWSVFHRPAHIIAFPILFFFILSLKGVSWKSFRMAVLYSAIAIIPFVIADSVWLKYNFDKTDRIVFLQDEDQICFTALAEYHVAVRNLVIQRGGDFKEWSRNTELAWIMDGNPESKFNFRKHYFTEKYPIDSLVALKDYYTIARSESTSSEVKSDAKRKTEELAERMAQDYKEERKFDYYFLNRIRLMQLFAFSGTVENLPLPSRANSNWVEIGVKVFYVVLFHLVVLLFFLGFIYALFQRNWEIMAIASFPLAVIFIIGAYLGYAEQRYLTPAYPIMMVVAAFIVHKFTKNRQAL